MHMRIELSTTISQALLTRVLSVLYVCSNQLHAWITWRYLILQVYVYLRNAMLGRHCCPCPFWLKVAESMPWLLRCMKAILGISVDPVTSTLPLPWDNITHSKMSVYSMSLQMSVHRIYWHSPRLGYPSWPYCMFHMCRNSALLWRLEQKVFMPLGLLCQPWNSSETWVYRLISAWWSFPFPSRDQSASKSCSHCWSMIISKFMNDCLVNIIA